jgi:hypothetical protein
MVQWVKCGDWDVVSRVQAWPGVCRDGDVRYGSMSFSEYSEAEFECGIDKRTRNVREANRQPYVVYVSS